MTAIRIAISICVILFAATATLAQDTDIIVTRESGPAAGSIKLTEIAGGFNRPIYVTHAGDESNRLFLIEQSGKIWILNDGARSAQPFLDVSRIISPAALGAGFTEQGLLGLAFHPDYAANGAFFVNFTDGNGDTVVAKYQVSESNPFLADVNNAQVVFRLAQPYSNHNGGHIDFGPDGYLYIALGDGGWANDPLGAGQNRGLLLATILRIDIDGDRPYAIPPDNPFVDDPNAHDEIWAYGLRNVWRFSFDRLTGDMYFADVGQNQWEEINFQPADSPGGENYGWNVWEGNHIFAGGSAPNHVPPIFEYTRNMGCSVTGGYVYRGQAVPELQAAYIFGDFCTGRIWATWRDPDLNWQTQQIMNTDLEISSFGEDENGELYVIDYGGSLYRFDPADA